MLTEDKLAIAMRAKVGVIWIPSAEEVRIERAITEVADGLS